MYTHVEEFYNQVCSFMENELSLQRGYVKIWKTDGIVAETHFNVFKELSVGKQKVLATEDSLYFPIAPGSFQENYDCSIYSILLSIHTIDEEKVAAIVEITASVEDHNWLMKRSLRVLDWITVIVHFISGYISVAQQKHDNTFLLQIVQ